MNRRALTGIAAVLSSIALLVSGCSSGSEASSSPPRTVHVSATGSAELAPDAAKAAITVSMTKADSASSAQNATARSTAAVIAAVRKAGVPEADIATQSISVTPTYRYSSNGTQSLSGYQATQSLTITLRDLTSAGATLDAIVAAGVNSASVDSVSTYVSDPAAASKKARAHAVEIARGQAEQYAELLGFTLGDVASVTETSASSPVPIAMADASVGGKVSTPIQPGSSTVTVSLDIAWLIE